MTEHEYLKDLFKNDIIGKTIKEINFCDYNSEYDDNNTYSVSSIEFTDGTSITFQASGQVGIDAVWMSFNVDDK